MNILEAMSASRKTHSMELVLILREASNVCV